MTTTTSPASTTVTRIDYAVTLDQRSKVLILIGVLLGLFLSALDQTIVSTALPRIVADLKGIELIGWVSTGYLLASTSMVPIYGKLSDIYGRKYVLLFGIAVFLLGSLLCGLAGDMTQLVFYRGLQGFGAAALTSTAFAIPADLFAPAERARYMGLFGAVFGLSSVVGPFIGGLLTDNLSWHWVFFVNLPLGVVALGFIIAKLPRLHSGLKPAIDYAGAATLLLTVIPFLLALTLDKNDFSWTSPFIISLFAVSAIGLIFFLLIERRAESPILPLHLFRNRTFTLTTIIGFTVGATLFAAIFFLSLYLVNVLGVSATAAGTTLIPLTLSLVVGAMVSSQIVQRTGRYKWVIVGGMAIIVAALWWLTTLTPDTSVWMVRLRMIALGLGLGPSMPILNLAMQNAVPRTDMGAATASRQFFQQLGQVVGSAVFGALLTGVLTTTLTANLAPIQAQLPPEMAARFDSSTLRNGMGAGEGASGETVDPAVRIEQAIADQFASRRDLLTRALRDADPAAIEALRADPQLPDQQKAMLDMIGNLPAAARAQALDRVLAQLDRAEQKARAEGRAIGEQISAALKDAFTKSVTTIYWYAIWLAVIGLALALFIPELPLKQNYGEDLPPLME
ncbi:MDR family MFS transporter [Chloroflexus aggregans]|uniref:Drug resistance transporter, EmrB/QacA subfamily n=1 Tax=Chloroflexus aggregans (strain MD-66 / DSM 9485) TaxID=326427 RepID=B8GCY5_CHLAD|nr:MDR family MFS transporter [Chloroflexus aggregans]ACL23185.1 drug resistance transporter, EmrB/QacA subfamily [Chloroflexus aggregans DSM 9485]